MEETKEHKKERLVRLGKRIAEINSTMAKIQKEIDVLDGWKDVGCGKEVCGVTTREEFDDHYGEEDVDIRTCGEYCPHHKKVHYCKECE